LFGAYLDAGVKMHDAKRPEVASGKEPRARDAADAAERAVARSFYRTLRENGYSATELLAVSTELIDLVTRDLDRHDAVVDAPAAHT
jgi:hypothetical protein